MMDLLLRRSLRFSAALLMALLLSGCVGPAPAIPPAAPTLTAATPTAGASPTVALTADASPTPVSVSDTGGAMPAIELKTGQELRVVLESNPTTGYRWQLADPLNESILKFLQSEYRAQPPVAVGSGGEEIWTFRAVSPGQVTLTLIYVQPWAKADKPARTWTSVVIVR